VCLARNPRLLYGRMTGWGQDGPWAARAGHDIDYLALAGALEPLGRAGAPPTPPINVLADFAGGGMLLALGLACGLVDVARTGRGQVVDAAMVDGAALLLAPFFVGRAGGSWGPRGTNPLDTGAHFYEVYETGDGRFVAVGAIEPQFYAELLRRLGLDGDESLAAQWDRERWPTHKERLAAVFRTRTRDEWAAVFEGSDACVAPVLDPVEAPDHPHAVARGAFVDVAGVRQPGPAPRFSATAPPVTRPPVHPGEGSDEALADWGFAPDEVDGLRASGALA
jgi:alpha-methylacyl-CoA racemase